MRRLPSAGTHTGGAAAAHCTGEQPNQTRAARFLPLQRPVGRQPALCDVQLLHAKPKKVLLYTSLTAAKGSIVRALEVQTKA